MAILPMVSLSLVIKEVDIYLLRLAHRVGESNFGAMGQVNRDYRFGGVSEFEFGAMGQVNRDSLFGGLCKLAFVH